MSEQQPGYPDDEFPRKSTAAALLKFIDESEGWAGNDLKELLDEVYAIRGKANFDVPTGHQSLQSADSEASGSQAKAIESKPH